VEHTRRATGPHRELESLMCFLKFKSVAKSELWFSCNLCTFVLKIGRSCIRANNSVKSVSSVVLVILCLYGSLSIRLTLCSTDRTGQLGITLLRVREFQISNLDPRTDSWLRHFVAFLRLLTDAEITPQISSRALPSTSSLIFILQPPCHCTLYVWVVDSVVK
jgi:hypothetical protein